MADREKVFDAIRNCVTEPKCKDCPWEDCEKIGCKRTKVPVTLLLDTLNLLKEQEPKPVELHTNAYGTKFYFCPKCKRELFHTRNLNFCEKCGQAVKWE